MSREFTLGLRQKKKGGPGWDRPSFTNVLGISLPLEAETEAVDESTFVETLFEVEVIGRAEADVSRRVDEVLHTDFRTGHPAVIALIIVGVGVGVPDAGADERLPTIEIEMVVSDEAGGTREV